MESHAVSVRPVFIPCSTALNPSTDLLVYATQGRIEVIGHPILSLSLDAAESLSVALHSLTVMMRSDRRIHGDRRIRQRRNSTCS